MCVCVEPFGSTEEISGSNTLWPLGLDPFLTGRAPMGQSHSEHPAVGVPAWRLSEALAGRRIDVDNGRMQVNPDEVSSSSLEDLIGRAPLQ